MNSPCADRKARLARVPSARTAANVQRRWMFGLERKQGPDAPSPSREVVRRVGARRKRRTTMAGRSRSPARPYLRMGPFAPERTCIKHFSGFVVRSSPPSTACRAVRRRMRQRTAREWSEFHRTSMERWNSDESALGVGNVGRLRLKWRRATGGGYSAPAVVDGVVYIGSARPSLYALSATTGARLWN